MTSIFFGGLLFITALAFAGVLMDNRQIKANRFSELTFVILRYLTNRSGGKEFDEIKDELYAYGHFVSDDEFRGVISQLVKSGDIAYSPTLPPEGTFADLIPLFITEKGKQTSVELLQSHAA